MRGVIRIIATPFIQQADECDILDIVVMVDVERAAPIANRFYPEINRNIDPQLD